MEDDRNHILVRVADASVRDEPQGPIPPMGSDAQQQAFWNRKPSARDIPLKADALREGIESITAKLEGIFEAREPTLGRAFELKSFSVGLAINASGKVVLVGEIGAEASIEMTFERTRQ